MVISSNGRNYWYIPTILRSFCSIDIEYFPFDEQSCPLTFGSWTYHGLDLDLNLADKGTDLKRYQSSGEFELLTFTAKRHTINYRYVKEISIETDVPAAKQISSLLSSFYLKLNTVDRKYFGFD